MNDFVASVEDSFVNQTNPSKQSAKKKRNLPGTPDPDSEVIALSPKTLLATNRFVCEICHKGFQRDQNLQLHMRGHNLPWKLKQRSSLETKKKVYVCPEPGCLHHDPSRALGDLTGIKKHFSRKHGEKKWKCEKCSKNYAVQSDWKAHLKICGTKEYKCDCGTMFSRRDTFITHRAFCDALSQESAKAPIVAVPCIDDEGPKIEGVALSSSPPPPPSAVLSPTPPIHAFSLPNPGVSSFLPAQNQELHAVATNQILEETTVCAKSVTGGCSSSGSCSNGSSSSNICASLFATSTSSESLRLQTTGYASLFESVSRSDLRPEVAPSSASEPVSLCLSMNHGSSIFLTPGQECRQYFPAQQPAMSATALLQKAAQVGSATSNGSLLRGLGIVSSSSSSESHQEWSSQQIEHDGKSLATGLALGLAGDDGSNLKELMLGTPSVFGPKHITTLDFLGLGIAASVGSKGGLSDLMTSINGDVDVNAASPPFSRAEF